MRFCVSIFSRRGNFLICTWCMLCFLYNNTLHCQCSALLNHKWLHWFKQTLARENSQIRISFENFGQIPSPAFLCLQAQNFNINKICFQCNRQASWKWSLSPLISKYISHYLTCHMHEIRNSLHRMTLSKVQQLHCKFNIL